ncbi:transposase [Fulvivirgaceae bacterium BMA10]|uniref:Transposase n=1 Tax=Splendidivirga corallicola TaxID=3051826 RepID=A0ABT8KXQ9_9BACT|nr:transposase [Fulvivirgaceae bacterium BMA10]
MKEPLQPGYFYHIYNHANGNENLFLCDENYRFFLQQWVKYIEPVAHTYAYCLMPNHFHALVRIKSEEALTSTFGKFETFQKLERRLSKQFANLFSSYTQAFNKMYDRKGSLFIQNFKRKPISSDDYLSNIIFYIHHNPLHHGFTNNIEDWPHSSYHALISDKKTRLERAYVNKWFGGKERLRAFHQQSIKGLKELEMEFT